jgi:hypothetical protein
MFRLLLSHLQALKIQIQVTRFVYRIVGYISVFVCYICNTAISLQQWLHERASALRCPYIACLLILYMFRPYILTIDTKGKEPQKSVLFVWTVFGSGYSQ